MKRRRQKADGAVARLLRLPYLTVPENIMECRVAQTFVDGIRDEESQSDLLLFRPKTETLDLITGDKLKLPRKRKSLPACCNTGDRNRRRRDLKSSTMYTEETG